MNGKSDHKKMNFLTLCMVVVFLLSSTTTGGPLSISIETISLSSMYETIAKAPNGYGSVHLVNALSYQSLVIPKPFLKFSTNRSSDDAFRELSTLTDTIGVEAFMRRNVQGYSNSSVGACCNSEDTVMLYAWEYVEDFIAELNTYNSTTGSARTFSKLLPSLELELKQQFAKRKTSSVLNPEKSSVTSQSFASSMGGQHWLLDQEWSNFKMVVSTLDKLDHLFLNLKNVLYLGVSAHNRTLSISELEQFTFNQMFHLIPAEGVDSVIIVRTNETIKSENLISRLSQAQYNQIVAYIENNIKTTILQPITQYKYEKNYDCDMTTSAKLKNMRTYHMALMRAAMGFGYLNDKQKLSIRVYLAYYDYLMNYGTFEIPNISVLNDFTMKALGNLYNNGSLTFLMDGYNTSKPFNESEMLSVCYGWRQDCNNFVLTNYVNSTCYGVYNQYFAMFHYKYYGAYEYFVYKDVILGSISMMAFIYYLGLIVTFVLNRGNGNISIRRRLTLPYIGPICFLALPIYFLEPTWNRLYIAIFRSNTTFSVAGLYPCLFISLFFGTYSATVIRFYYLRNLYWIMNKLASKKRVISDRQMRFHKIMVSKLTNVISIFIITAVIFGAWLGYYFNMFGNEDANYYSAYNMQFEMLFLIPFASLVILLSLLCIICLIVDMIANRKKIRQKGVMYFLFFDDPMYLRIDLIVMLMVTALACFLFMALGEETASASKGFLFVLFFMCYLVVGGNAVCGELFKVILGFLRGTYHYKRQVDDDGKTPFEIHMADHSFRKMFHTYATNEFSVENYELYIEMEKLSKSSNLTIDQVQHIDETYVKRFSPFEVNLPSGTKKEFYCLLQSATDDNSNIPYDKLESILLQEVLNNIRDTFSRLEQTTEYFKWMETKRIQKESEI